MTGIARAPSSPATTSSELGSLLRYLSGTCCWSSTPPLQASASTCTLATGRDPAALASAIGIPSGAPAAAPPPPASPGVFQDLLDADGDVETMAMWRNVKGASAKVVVLFRCLLNVATSESEGQSFSRWRRGNRENWNGLPEVVGSKLRQFLFTENLQQLRRSYTGQFQSSEFSSLGRSNDCGYQHSRMIQFSLGPSVAGPLLVG
ncbi:hypothetical protein GQ55_9G470600 [Panicum hallii var. hallii]|uniref:Uncharacterized protein n=1 Tax=Panicum hallii var. hallii TaxID=1504633 RepID=A0A2T7CCH9_9POAL|nr:hypothetical protein GQ55_9G470600 [Panicum hallii var. hallii]